VIIRRSYINSLTISRDTAGLSTAAAANFPWVTWFALRYGKIRDSAQLRGDAALDVADQHEAPVARRDTRGSGSRCRVRTAAMTTTDAIDDKTRTELEAAVFRRLVAHLRDRSDVQNIDLMNLAGFCRNCLSNWLKDAADENGVALSKDDSREAVYGMPYDTWKSLHQAEASPEQLETMKKAHSGH
jgi:hypothetical protein